MKNSKKHLGILTQLRESKYKNGDILFTAWIESVKFSNAILFQFYQNTLLNLDEIGYLKKGTFVFFDVDIIKIGNIDILYATNSSMDCEGIIINNITHYDLKTIKFIFKYSTEELRTKLISTIKEFENNTPNYDILEQIRIKIIKSALSDFFNDEFKYKEKIRENIAFEDKSSLQEQNQKVYSSIKNTTNESTNAKFKMSFNGYKNEKNENYQTKRIIDEVLDMETGEIIKSTDFFKYPESQLIAYRRHLGEAILGLVPPKFVCSYCKQLVKLSGKRTVRGEVSFFSHLYDSDDCDIKTNSGLSKSEIEARKYSNSKESLRHKKLKNEIAEALEGNYSKTLGVKNVEIEKRVTSDVPYLHWRQPDISTEYGDINIVFELQLSITFLRTIIERDIFYRMNNTFIIWVFNFSDNIEYVNLENLMCKDIYYANKRNAFIFDDNAQQKSKEEKQLVLCCTWYEPVVENGVFNAIKSRENKKEEYVRLSDLSFDKETYKPFFKDADSLFFQYQPELKQNRIDLELFEYNLIKKNEKRLIENELSEKKEKEKIDNIKQIIKNGLDKLRPFAKKDKWGYDCMGVVILEPTFSTATEISEKGFGTIKKSNKYGLINQCGDIILNCDYKELIFTFDKSCVVNQKNEWFYIDLETNYKTFIHKSKNIASKIQLEAISSKAVVIKIEETVGVLLSSNIFYKYESIGAFIDCKAIVKKTGLYGCINNIGNTIIPFEYTSINDFVNGKAIAKKNEKYGYIDNTGKIIIPFEYDDIEEFIDKKAIIYKNGKYGYIDNTGEIIIPLEYDSIEEFIDGKAKAHKNGKKGYLNSFGDIIIEEVIEISNDILKGKKFEKWGIQTNTGEVIVPFQYDIIGVVKNKFIAAKSDTLDVFIFPNIQTQSLNLEVSGVVNFGVFFNFGKLQGLLHVSKIERSERILESFSKGEFVELYISSVDIKRKRISFSLLPIAENKYINDNFIENSLELNSVHTGTVIGIESYGVFVTSKYFRTALLHYSELKKHKLKITEFKVNQQFEVKIQSIDEEKKRISLTL